MLTEPQFRSALGDRVWSGEARLARMAAFEAALAGAQAAAGLVPGAAAEVIASVCAGGVADANTVYEAAREAGNPAIPFVKALTAAVAAVDGGAAGCVHYGATSQDLIDTAHMLALAEIADGLDPVLARAGADLRALALAHAETPMAARTLLQQAAPITFGLQAALWATAVARARARLGAVRREEMAVQLGGATGSLAVMGEHGVAIRADLGRRLGLADPGFCWHVVRDRVLAVAVALVGVVAAAAKVAGDVMLAMQSEVGELGDAGRGGSSALPHKQNPVDSLLPAAALPVVAGHLAALAAAQAHPHQRAAGQWHAEWAVLPALSGLALAAGERLAGLVAGLEVDSGRMAANLALTKGALAGEALAAALAGPLGREAAHALVADLAGRGGDFAAAARAEARIGAHLDDASLADILSHRRPLAAAAAEARRLVAALPEA